MGELQKRQDELDKIESLDTKITDELRQVENKQKQYEDEMENKFDRLGDMQTSGSDQIQRLGTRKQYLEGTISVLKQQVGVLRLKHDSRKQQLVDDVIAYGLHSQEDKI